MDPFAHDVCLAALDQMPIGVTVADLARGGFVWRNRTAERILGRLAAWLGEPWRYSATHEDGRPYAADEYPLARAARDGEVVSREALYYRAKDGRPIILEVNAARLEVDNGRLLGVCAFQDVTAEYESRRALTDAAERVQLALDAGAIVGTWVWNVPTDCLTADELFANAFGLDPERCRIGISASEGLPSVHPDDRQGVQAAVEEAIERGGAYHYQYRVLQHDGAYRWVEASGRVEKDENGAATRFLGVLLDIAERKQAEEARNLLMLEVDHRARNALVMVQSVVRLTDASDPARFRDEVNGRIDAMARAQGSLSRSNWAGGVLEDLLTEEVAVYASAEQFTRSGPAVTLPADQVLPFSMIIHELATNAIKHGPLSGPRGRVAVRWTADRDGRIELTWTESGGPAVAPPTRSGFGSRLIARLAVQLGGTVELDWPTAGLTARISWRA